MKQIIYILLSTFLTFSACHYDYDQGFSFYNKATRDVYIYCKLGATLYPDTGIARVRVGVPFKTGESRHYTISRSKRSIWSDVDTISLFIFDAEIFNTYSWEDIQNDYKILQRYDISHENIKALEFEISYPPDGRMKNMKMYPPYGK